MSQTADDARDFYTIPSYSSWFVWDEIHDTERRALPEFFDGTSISRNPRVYNEYRNFIINKYREDPSRRLTFTEVRKSLVGDVGSISKVFAFLDRCGLINFGVPALTGVPAAGPDIAVEDVVSGQVRVVRVEQLGTASGGGARENGFRLPPLTSYGDVFGEWMPGAVCGDCGEKCAAGVSESAKGASVTCLRCSKNENFVGAKPVDEPKSEDEKPADEQKSEDEKPADEQKSEARTDAEGGHVTGVWSDAETLLLLEAVLKHGEDWDLITQHVRTKSKLDCIARLVQLPFGEHMLGTVSSKPHNTNSSGQIDVKTSEQMSCKPLQGPAKEDGHHQMDTDPGVAGDSVPVHTSKRESFPFVNSTGSLMQQVALLSTVAGPHIATASAEAAVTALCNENPYLAEAFDIDANDIALASINNIGKTFNVNGQGMESDIKVEDLDMERHKQTDLPMEDANFPAIAFRIRGAIATSLGAAAARAKLLADQEEREMQHLMASIIEAQMRKIQYKIKHFEELEPIMETECRLIQEAKEGILEEWVTVVQQASQAGVPRWRDQGSLRSLLSSTL